MFAVDDFDSWKTLAYNCKNKRCLQVSEKEADGKNFVNQAVLDTWVNEDGPQKEGNPEFENLLVGQLQHLVRAFRLISETIICGQNAYFINVCVTAIS